MQRLENTVINVNVTVDLVSKKHSESSGDMYCLSVTQQEATLACSPSCFHTACVVRGVICQRESFQCGLSRDSVDVEMCDWKC